MTSSHNAYTETKGEAGIAAEAGNVAVAAGRVSILHGVGESRPEELAPYHLAATAEKTRRIHEALKEARRLYRARFGNLIECIQRSGAGPETWHARTLLGSLLFAGHLTHWAQHNSTRRSDVYRLLDRAIRQTRQMRGGWLVSLPGGRK